MTPLLPKSLSLLSLCLIFTLLCQTTLAQSVRDSWDEARKTKPGSKLTIKTKTGQKHEGRVKEIAADSITLSSKSAGKSAGSDVELKREDIAEIRKKSGAQTAGYAAMLGGVGFAGGYGIGYGVGEAKDSRFRPEYPIAAVGAAAGAVVGAIISSKGRVIYKAP